jgi:hypothetical protein
MVFYQYFFYSVNINKKKNWEWDSSIEKDFASWFNLLLFFFNQNKK